MLTVVWGHLAARSHWLTTCHWRPLRIHLLRHHALRTRSLALGATMHLGLELAVVCWHHHWYHHCRLPTEFSRWGHGPHGDTMLLALRVHHAWLHLHVLLPLGRTALLVEHHLLRLLLALWRSSLPLWSDRPWTSWVHLVHLWLPTLRRHHEALTHVALGIAAHLALSLSWRLPIGRRHGGGSTLQLRPRASWGTKHLLVWRSCRLRPLRRLSFRLDAFGPF
mmetsp:Transcript_9086/g.20209  ORF Transcript_9086/g.20209 Transcript_9086/m.20209 type:complete len:222 (-) Transcript_9086:1674-2339(-)